MKPPRFTVLDAARAHEEWGCNCGPGALAAMLDLTLEDVRPAIPDFEARRYTNPSMMKSALRSLGRRFVERRAAWPAFGLVRIQWEGPWMDPGVPVPARYRYTHWIGTKLREESRGVFDINCMHAGTGWVSLENWSEHVAPTLAALYPRSTGCWGVTHGLELATS